jgi:hypothetical protein
MLTPDEKRQIEEQIKLSKSLGLGFALSLIPLYGVGSVAALVIGFRAKKRIAASQGRLAGAGMAAWCIIVGSAGVLVGGSYLIFLTLKN